MRIAMLGLVALFGLSAMAPDTYADRKKELSFDNSVVEGLNSNPLDSLESVGRKDRGNQPHLYRKRLHFKEELQNSVREARPQGARP